MNENCVAILISFGETSRHDVLAFGAAASAPATVDCQLHPPDFAFSPQPSGGHGASPIAPSSLGRSRHQHQHFDCGLPVRFPFSAER